MDTAPRHQVIDQLAATAVAIEQPLVMLLENGPAFSVLLARRASPEPDDGAVFFEDCTQVRIEENEKSIIRKFDLVEVKREPKRSFWIASPDQFRSAFSQPSEDPYVLLELSRQQATGLNRAVKKKDFDSVFVEMHGLFSRLPRFFAPTETELRAPENYATGRDYFKEIERFI